MKFHKQLVVDAKRGDCFRTCVACILDRDVESVPNFCEKDSASEQWEQIVTWLHSQGWGFVKLYPHDRNWWINTEGMDGVLCIASIPSLRYEGGSHAVVAQLQVDRKDGSHSPARVVLVHDPSPRNPPYPWFTKADSVIVLIPRLADRLPTFTKALE